MEIVENIGIPVEEHHTKNKHENLKDDCHKQIRRVLDQWNALRFAVQPPQNLLVIHNKQSRYILIPEKGQNLDIPKFGDISDLEEPRDPINDNQNQTHQDQTNHMTKRKSAGNAQRFALPFYCVIRRKLHGWGVSMEEVWKDANRSLQVPPWTSSEKWSEGPRTDTHTRIQLDDKNTLDFVHPKIGGKLTNQLNSMQTLVA